jgi:hypothetical protein
LEDAVDGYFVKEVFLALETASTLNIYKTLHTFFTRHFLNMKLRGPMLTDIEMHLPAMVLVIVYLHNSVWAECVRAGMPMARNCSETDAQGASNS